MKLREIEMQYDDHTVFVGDVGLGDLGMPNDSIHIENFSVIVWIGAIDHDITKGLSAKTLDGFKRSFALHVYEKHLDDLRDIDFDEGA